MPFVIRVKMDQFCMWNFSSKMSEGWGGIFSRDSEIPQLGFVSRLGRSYVVSFRITAFVLKYKIKTRLMYMWILLIYNCAFILFFSFLLCFRFVSGLFLFVFSLFERGYFKGMYFYRVYFWKNMFIIYIYIE